MKAFVDSSVVLRLLFSEAHPLPEWRKIETAYVSRLLLLEIGRVIDRVRLTSKIDDAQVVNLHIESRRLLAACSVVALDEDILQIAAGPMPTSLGTLDALHLATALAVSRELGERLTLATHDKQLAAAARAMGLEVIGV